MSITYEEQVRPYINFTSVKELDSHYDVLFSKHRQQFTKGESSILYKLKGNAAKYKGAVKISILRLMSITGYSMSTIKRTLHKALKYGILKSFSTRKANNSKKGVTVYQFQRADNAIVEQQKEPLKKKHRENTENPYESKAEDVKKETEALSFKHLSLKDTKATNSRENLKNGLLSKIPLPIKKAIEPFFDDINEIYKIVGAIYNGKKNINKSIRIESYSDFYYTTIVSVIESFKRATAKNKEFNIYKVMCKAIERATKQIVDGSLLETKDDIKRIPASNNKNVRVEKVQDWFEKHKLESKMKVDLITETLDNERDKIQMNFEKERAKILQKLGIQTGAM